MLEFLVDNIFVVFAGKVFQQIIGMPMGANCAPLLADKFLTLSRIYTVFALNTKETVGISVQLFVHKQPRVRELPWQDVSRWTWDQRHDKGNTSTSHLDLLLSVGRDCQLQFSIYDKSDDFNFHITNISITNFPFLSSNIPASTAYAFFISQRIRYARACSSYGCFILRATRLSNKFHEQGHAKERLKLLLRKFYGRYGGSYQTIWRSPLTNAKWPSVAWPKTMTTLHRSDFIPIRGLFTELDHLPNYERFPLNICDGRGMPTGDACLLLRTTGPIQFGTCMCSTCWDKSFSRICRYFSRLCSSNIPRYFLDFAVYFCNNDMHFHRFLSQFIRLPSSIEAVV